MSWYKAGTVSVTNGSAVVTGTGTAFVANVKVGDAFVGPDDRSYEIVTVNSNTSLTISPAYLGSNQSGQSYRIQPTNGITVDLTNSVQSLIATYSGVLAGVGAGKFPDGTVSAPFPCYEADQDSGWRRVGSNRISLVTGGVDRMVWDGNGNVGVGTTTPAFPLHSVGDIGLAVTSTSPNTGQTGVAFGLAAGPSQTKNAILVAPALSGPSWGRGDMYFCLNDEGNASNVTLADARMVVRNNGSVGIGATDPVTELDVNGNARIRGGYRLIFGDYISSVNHGPSFAYNASGDFFDIVSGFNADSDPQGIEGIRFGLPAGSSWTARFVMGPGTFRPSNSNSQDLGTSAQRFKDLFLVNAPSVSSDERLKNWQRSTLTEGEIAAGERILGELGYFQWLDMIAEKGVENARWHYGALAQEVVRIFIDEGVEDIDPALLDIEPDVFVAEEDRPSMRQAFLTFDTWEAAYEDDVLVRSAGNVFGFRPEQLALFLLRVSHELRLRDKAAAELQMDALEQRIAVLEGV